MDIKLSKIFGTIWCVLVFSTDCCGTKTHVFLPLRLASAVLELQLPNPVILKQLGITSN